MSDTLTLVEEVARQAGAILRDGFGRVTHVEHKGATDLVTDYDRRSEALIVTALRARFPDHAVLAEEGGASGGDGSSGGYRWLVDPLDGTTNFAHGLPTFAVSIALTLDNRPIVGVVYDPMRDELFAAEAAKGATLNGAPIRVSAETSLQEALLATGFTYDLRNAPRDNFREFKEIHLQVQGIRRAGAAALDGAWVGAGRLDAYWEFGVKPWDIAAGALIVQEAGGRASTTDGGADFVGSDSILVSNGHLHERMLALLRQRSGSPA
jgi:myo-inositol-1(or 4)-monophosphatase